MPIDASIPLSVQQPKIISPADLLSLKDLSQRTQLNEQEIQKKSAITQALQGPGSIDPQTGRLSLQAIGAVTQIEPELGARLGQQQETLRLRDLQLNERKQSISMKIGTSYVQAYDRYLIQTGGNKEEAKRLAAADRASAIDEMDKTGVFAANGISEPEIMRIRSTVRDPDQVRSLVTAMGGTIAKPQGPLSNLGKLKEDLQNNRITKQEYDREAAKLTAPTPATLGATGFQGRNGELMAALAERGVTLPQGFRSTQQQVGLLDSLWKRNPNLTADQIADKVKSGQISLGAEKKETQTAAGVAGRVGVAGEEIAQFAPLVEEASKAVPRGKFVPINKLMQMSEASISDPNLKKLKVYINSTLNAYDQLAARGGTDKDKRAEAHSLLLSAESHEALMAGLEAFKKEVVAARNAADIASRPRSERDSAREKLTGSEKGVSKSGRPMHKNADGKWEYD